MAASDAHWHFGETLKQRASYLIDEILIPTEVREMVNHMHDEGHITYRQRQDITQLSITSKQMDALLEILILKSDKASYHCLIKKLKESNHNDIVEELNNTMTTVKTLPKPSEEGVEEMLKRTELGIMHHEIPMSQVLRCLRVVAQYLRPSDTQAVADKSSTIQHKETFTPAETEREFERLLEACEHGKSDIVKQIIAHTPNCINMTNTKGETPLIVATHHTNVEVITELLRSDSIDANIKDNAKRTALMYCVLRGDTEMLSVLLKSGKVHLSERDGDGLSVITYIFGTDFVEYLASLGSLIENVKVSLTKTAIYEIHFIRHFAKIKELRNKIATWENITSIVECLFSNSQGDQTDLFKLCLTLGNPDLISMLLESGKIEFEKSGIMEYCYAIVSSINPTILNVLVHQGLINLKSLSTVEIEALVESVIRYNCPRLSAQTTKLVHDLDLNEALRTVLLLQATPADILNTTLDRSRIDLNAKDKSGNTVLYLLLKFANYETVTELLQRTDIDMTPRNDLDQTFFMLALMNSDKKVAKLLLDTHTERIGVNEHDKFHTSTLMYACECSNVDIVKSLIANDMIDINARDTSGCTALMNMCSYGRRFEFFYILDVKETDIKKRKVAIDVFKRSNRLSVLIYTHHTEIITVLLNSPKNDITTVGSSGKSVLTHACIGGNADTVSQVIEKGASINVASNNGFTALMEASMFAGVDVVQLLLRAGAKIDVVDIWGNTAIKWACAAENVDNVTLLVDEGADVNIGNEDGITPLHIASMTNNTEIVQLLISANAKINGDDCTRMETALFKASEAGNTDTVALLVKENADINRTDGRGRTPLRIACDHRHVEVARLLLNGNADPNVAEIKEISSSVSIKGLMAEAYNNRPKRYNRPKRNTPNTRIVELLHNETYHTDVTAMHLGWTALHSVCATGDMELTSLLLSAGSNPNATDRKGMMPLHWACKSGKAGVVSLLLTAGNDPNVAPCADNTPLHVGVGHVEIVPLLLTAGANPNKTNNHDMTPLHRACEYGNPQTMSLLLDAGADPNAVDCRGNTPLHMVCMYSTAETVSLLLNAGADPHTADGYGVTPLHSACTNNKTEHISLLLDAGADPKAADCVGQMPLHKACIDGNAETIPLLVDAGADINAADHDGRTALHEACWYGKADLIPSLLDAGANINAQDVNRQTSLHIACLSGQTQSVSPLLTAGADSNVKDCNQKTPFQYVDKGGELSW